MQSYKATAPVSLHEGTLVQLTKEQAASRAHAVEQQGSRGSIYLVKARIEFKAGEIFKIDGEPPKHLAEAVQSSSKKADGAGVQTSAPGGEPPAPPAPAPSPASSSSTEGN